MNKYISQYLSKLTLIFVLSYLLILTGCNRDIITGSGEVVTKSVDLQEFHSIYLAGNFKAKVNKSDKFSVEIKTDENILDYIDIINKNNGLIIETKANAFIQVKNPIELVISGDSVNKVTLSGSSAIKINNLQSDWVMIDIAGAAEIEAKDINTNRLVIAASGSSDIEIDGKAKTAKYDLSGSSELNAKSLEAENVAINVSGSSDIKVYANDTLKIKASGSSEVKYYGKPKQVSQDVSGSSKVKSD